MENEVKRLEEEFNRECRAAEDAQAVELLRVKYLGRKAVLTQLFSKIPAMPQEERGFWGKRLNELKQRIAASIEDRVKGAQAREEKVDLTFPSVSPGNGSQHILSDVVQKICSVFENMGFAVIEGGEVEDEWHNFGALNFPSDHPSRDAFDTFYLDMPQANKQKGKHLLRCHTSPSQIRVMQKNKPPLAVISPGRVYRPDEVDATHSFMFHQVEGFAVSENISFADLKGVLFCFAHKFFSPDVQLRFRPHFFPFTEPSAEVDISCIICGGKTKEQKCSVCKGKGWLEVLGCGMIHPNVLEACAIDSKKYQGFAFGMGVERIAMLKYGINDIRLFCENDVRFLEQFNSY